MLILDGFRICYESSHNHSRSKITINGWSALGCTASSKSAWSLFFKPKRSQGPDSQRWPNYHRDQTEITNHGLPLDSSNLQVQLNLEHRQKGLLWYSTYRVNSQASTPSVIQTPEPQKIFVRFWLPSQDAGYENFSIFFWKKQKDGISNPSGRKNKPIPPAFRGNPNIKKNLMDPKEMEEVGYLLRIKLFPGNIFYI